MLGCMKRLTAREVAEAVGIAPSTFRAYVARGQAPKPDETIGRSAIWYDTTIARWRGHDSTPVTHIRAAVLQSKYRDYEMSLHGDLAQLGLSWENAQSLMGGRIRERMSVDQFEEAVNIIAMHQTARNLMDADGDVPDAKTENEVIAELSEAIANGDLTIFEGRINLALELVKRGFAEIVFPQHYSEPVWDAAESGDAKVIARMFASCGRTHVPDVSQVVAQ